MKTSKKTEPMTIDLTPTWVATMEYLIFALEGKPNDGKCIARAELRRVAKLLDHNLSTDKTPTRLPDKIAHLRGKLEETRHEFEEIVSDLEDVANEKHALIYGGEALDLTLDKVEEREGVYEIAVERHDNAEEAVNLIEAAETAIGELDA